MWKVIFALSRTEPLLFQSQNHQYSVDFSYLETTTTFSLEGTVIFFLFFHTCQFSIFTFLIGLSLDFSKVKIVSALDIFFFYLETTATLSKLQTREDV